MKASLNPTTANQIFSVLNQISDECILDISPAGWHVSLVDPANIAAIFLDIPPAEFAGYNCREAVQVGTCLNKINSVISEIIESLGLDEVVKFVFEPADEKHQTNENDRYKITIEHGMFRREMHGPPLAGIRRRPKVPDLNLPYSVMIDTRLFRRIVKCASQVSDYIRLGVRQSVDGFQFVAMAEDELGDPLTMLPVSTIECKSGTAIEAHSLFSIDYLQDIVKVIPDPITTLELGIDLPLIMQFGVGKYGNARYGLAPRVESE